MLPLVSSDDAEAHRHALGAEVRDFHRLVVFVDDESRPGRRPGTNRPLASDTVAVTLISSTPLLKRKPCSSSGRTGALLRLLSMRRHHDCGDDGGDDQRKSGHTDIGMGQAAGVSYHVLSSHFCHDDRRAGRRDRRSGSSRGTGRSGLRAGTVTTNARFAARPQHRRVDDGAAAADEAAIVLEQEHDRGDAVQRRARCRIADDAANGQSIAVAVVTRAPRARAALSLARLLAVPVPRVAPDSLRTVASPPGAARDDRERGHAAKDHGGRRPPRWRIGEPGAGVLPRRKQVSSGCRRERDCASGSSWIAAASAATRASRAPPLVARTSTRRRSSRPPAQSTISATSNRTSSEFELHRHLDDDVHGAPCRRAGAKRHCRTACTARSFSPPARPRRILISPTAAVAAHDDFEHDLAAESALPRVLGVVGASPRAADAAVRCRCRAGTGRRRCRRPIPVRRRRRRPRRGRCRCQFLRRRPCRGRGCRFPRRLLQDTRPDFACRPAR